MIHRTEYKRTRITNPITLIWIIAKLLYIVISYPIKIIIYLLYLLFTFKSNKYILFYWVGGLPGFAINHTSFGYINPIKWLIRYDKCNIIMHTEHTDHWE